MNRPLSQGKSFSIAAAALLLALLALYWPVLHADFAWDELLDSFTSISARSAHPWHTVLIGQSNGLATYFRPLVMALFSLEMHVFAFQPGPMHAVSLAMHALNVVLVGVLAMRLSAPGPGRASWRSAMLPMLVYGVHPLLIEPVSWIGCQYDLAMTTFTLLALLVNIAVEKPWLRATLVSLCFFLAACCKESAASFPLVLLAFDALLTGRSNDRGALARARAMLQKNGLVYGGVLLAGVAYLAFRQHYLGHLLQATQGHSLGALGRFQEVSYLFVHYQRMLVWPMTGLSPIHPVAAQQFRLLDMASLATDLTALALAGAAVVLGLRRQAVGTVLLVVMFSLLPVLHIVPVKFDASLYHERYAMTALALACCLLPLVIAQWAPALQPRPLLRMAAAGTLALWVFASVANVRATVPLWSSDILRWQWAYLEYPESDQAQESLLDAYVDHQAYGPASTMVDEMLARKLPCVICIVHAASEAVDTHQSALADMLLDRLDATGLRRGDEVARNYLDIRERIAADAGDSLFFRTLPGRATDANFEVKAWATGRQQPASAPYAATNVSADPLLAFARSKDASYHSPHPVFATSFPQAIDAGVITL